MGKSKKQTRRSVGLGVGPILILFFLFFAAIFALANGRTLVQLGVRIAIVTALVGVVYFVWYQIALRNPDFRMGTAGESTLVLIFAAIGFLYAADPLANSLQLSIVPSPMSYYEAQIASSQTVGVSVFAAMIVILALVITVCVRRKRK